MIVDMRYHDGNQCNVTATNLERGVTVQYKRPYGIDLTRRGETNLKELSYTRKGAYELFFRAVDLMKQTQGGTDVNVLSLYAL